MAIRKNFAILGIIIFTFTFSVCGQSGRPTDLVFGSEVSGNLGPGEAHFFTVKSKEDGMVIIETSGDLATRLEAFDQSNKKLWDNRGERGNAKIAIFVEAGKTYSIKLTEMLADLETWTTTPNGGSYQIVANFEMSSDQVYVVGFVGERQNRRAVLWRNGIPQFLSDTESGASYVYMSGSDMYVAGSVGSKATLWKNGEPQTLSNSESWAYSVYVSGSDIYVVGDLEYRATLWKNGVPQTLGNTESWANSVYVSGSDVYVSGNVRQGQIEKATLWKNDVPQTLSNTESHPESIFVSGSDVYVAGYLGSMLDTTRATLWKNGIPQTLSDTHSQATSVFVR